MDATDATLFGDQLRAQRRAAGLTQEALAERAGISVRAVTDLERGVIRAPRRDTLEMIASALDLPSDVRDEWEQLRRRLSKRGSRTVERESEPTSLPQPPNPLLGREREVSALVTLLSQPHVRLVTLTGPGGVGKTRVALQAGHELAHAFPSGVRFIELASLHDPDLLLPAISQELGLREGEERALRSRLQSYLSQREMLLILDNLEQLRSAAPELTHLVTSSSALKILVTSRAGLGLSSEYQFPLSSLPLPDWDNGRLEEQLERYPAIQLFVQRSQQVLPDFTVTEENAPAIASICAHLDGLPLAIELAAARIKVLPPEQMSRRLSDRLGFLTGGPQDAPDRHHTMRAAVGWSYDLLDDGAQWLFRQLSVFAGGWTLDAAEAVAAPEINVLDELDTLANSNLILQRTAPDGRARFDMLETVREYGLEQLDALGELEDARQRHGRYFLQLAETAEPELKGPDQGLWLALLAEELGNLRAALEWSERPDVAPELGLRLGGALSWFWESRGHLSEGQAWLSRALEREGADPAVRMRALSGAGWLAHLQHESGTALQLLQRSLDIAREIGDRWTEAWTLHLLGRVAYFDGDAETAREFGGKSLESAREIDDQWISAWALHLLALAAHIEQDFDTARGLYEQSLEIRKEIGYPEGIGTVTGLLGMLALNEGDQERALRLFHESLETNRQLGARWLIINMIANIVLIAAVGGAPDRAARLAGFVEEMSGSVGASPIPIAEAAFQRGLTETRQALGDRTFDDLASQGRTMSLDEAVDEALSVEPQIRHDSGQPA